MSAHLHIALKVKRINAFFFEGRYFHYSTFKWAAETWILTPRLLLANNLSNCSSVWKSAIFLFSVRSWKVGKKALKVLQAQVCTLAYAEGVHWTVNNDINVWQIKWLVNNLLTALTSKPLLCIDQPAVPGFVWWHRSWLWCLLGWMDRATKKQCLLPPLYLCLSYKINPLNNLVLLQLNIVSYATASLFKPLQKYINGSSDGHNLSFCIKIIVC